MKHLDSIGYVSHGHGPLKVMVLHDWIGDHSNYDAMLPFLDPDEFTYVFADLRGYGKSREMMGHYTLEEATEDVLHLSKILKWENFFIVGHSMSALIIQKLALEAHDKIIAALLISPVPACGIPLADHLWTFFMSTIENDNNFRELVNYLTGRKLSKNWLDFKLKQNRTTSIEQARHDYLIMWSKCDFSKDILGVKTPVRILIGEHEHEIFSMDSMKQTFLAWFPNAELIPCSNAGHYCMQEVPIFTASKIEEFFKQYA